MIFTVTKVLPLQYNNCF